MNKMTVTKNAAAWLAVWGLALGAGCAISETDDSADPTISEGNDSGEVALFANACSPTQMLTNPIAGQCCYGNPATTLQGGTAYLSTKHVNPSGAMVERKRNPSGGSCKAADGTSACSGNACYYGPYGYGRPIVTAAPGSTPYAKLATAVQYIPDPHDRNAPPTEFRYCKLTWSATPPTVEFGNVTGTLSTGLGCPGGVDGAGEWDY